MAASFQNFQLGFLSFRVIHWCQRPASIKSVLLASKMFLFASNSIRFCEFNDLAAASSIEVMLTPRAEIVVYQERTCPVRTCRWLFTCPTNISEKLSLLKIVTIFSKIISRLKILYETADWAMNRFNRFPPSANDLFRANPSGRVEWTAARNDTAIVSLLLNSFLVYGRAVIYGDQIN